MVADILVTHPPLCAEARAVLKEAGHRIFVQRDEPYTSPDVMWVRLDRVIPLDLDWTPGLKVLACNCTDVSHLPLDECARRNIRVLSLRDCREEIQSISATAELTIALILSLLRNLPAAFEHARQGGWDRYRFVGRELRGKRVGLIGCGRIGTQVWERLRLWGCAFERYDAQLPWSDLSECLRESDIITIHADLNPTSRHLFNAERLAQMKPGVLLVNTARGAIVDEAALLDALRSGHLAGAALDVTDPEPPSAELVRFAAENPGRLLLSPHLGGATQEGFSASETVLARKLCEVLGEVR